VLRRRILPVALAALAALPAFSQLDERRVSSPNGQIEFRLFIAPPPSKAELDGIAYQVWYRGKLLLDTSYLGLDVYNQVPFLGEKVGLVNSNTVVEQGFNLLLAEYLQNGSLGRRINVEARVSNEGVAFRYIIPRSAPLDDLLVADEITEYRFAPPWPPLSAADQPVATPFIVEAPGVAWVAIAESAPYNFASIKLQHTGEGKLATILPRSADKPWLSVATKTPFTTPWRIISIGPTRESVGHSQVAPGE
jgi:alpha-glucosidase